MNKAPFHPSNQWQDEGPSEDAVRALARRAGEGDEQAFGELVTMFHEKVYSVAYRFVHNADEANDLAQQAWIKAWNKLSGFEGKSAFFTWMYRVTSFVCLDYLRKKKRLAERELLEGIQPDREAGTEPAASAATRPDVELERREIRERFFAALEALSPEHRMVLTMREVDGLSYEEIAQAMECRKGTVMSRLFYARKNLQDAMKDVR